MNWFEVVIFALQLIIGGCLFFYKRYLEEMAKVLHAREIEYEKEKGKNDALHESVQTVLKEIELMKSSVLLEEQRRHKWIESRNQRLINLIKYSETINIGKAKLALAINNESKVEMEKLQTEIQSAILNLRVDTLSLMAINPEIDDHSVTTFSDAVFLLGNELAVRITNALSLLESYERMLNYALSIPDGQEKLSWMQKAVANKTSFTDMKNNTTYNAHDGFEDKRNQYFMYMRKVFGEGIVLKAAVG